MEGALRKPQGKGDTVYFESQGGMVALVYTPDDGRFAVKFTKFQGAWGDYIKAIARSLFTVLNTLKSAGLPFDAPPTLAGMAIEATTTDDNLTYVRWPGTPEQQPVQEGLDDLGEHLEGAGFRAGAAWTLARRRNRVCGEIATCTIKRHRPEKTPLTGERTTLGEWYPLWGYKETRKGFEMTEQQPIRRRTTRWQSRLPTPPRLRAATIRACRLTLALSRRKRALNCCKLCRPYGSHQPR
jgi:hypothetical protein